MRASFTVSSKVSLFQWKNPVGDHKVTNALFYSIPWNLRCFSLFSPSLIETECVHPSDDMLKENLRDTGHFKLKKEKKGIVFKSFTSVPPVLRDSDFYYLFSVANSLLFIFRHEISYWNQLRVYNLCWVPTTEKNSFWGVFSGIVCCFLKARNCNCKKFYCLV